MCIESSSQLYHKSSSSSRLFNGQKNTSVSTRAPINADPWLSVIQHGASIEGADIISDQAVVIFWGCPGIKPDLGISISN